MSTIDVAVPFRIKVLHVMKLVIASIARFLFCLYYGKEGQKLPPIYDDILKVPAVEVAKKIRNREITSVQVLEACIRRITDVNPTLNCFVEDRFDLAMNEAKEADQLIRSGILSQEELEKQKPFLGVPFTTKDCLRVKGLHNTSGVVLRKDVIADEDADAIRLLRQHGAVIIGLTNVPELCMWWETHNHIHGRTNNPYNTTRIVGGSSGGEGCIQAAAGSIFGIGSDIGGSIRMPAYFNGIFGHKPSRHIVSNVGQYPEPETEVQKSFLGIGPMTRFAVDLKPILNIISGENSSKLNLNKTVNVSDLKVFYQFSNNAYLVDPVDPEIISAMKKVIEFFDVKFKIKAEEKKITQLQKSMSIWMATMKTVKPFVDLMMEKGKSVWMEILKNFVGCSGNTLIALFTAIADDRGDKVGSKKYNNYLKQREEIESLFKDMLGENGVFLYPTHPTAAPYHNEPLLRTFNFSYTAIINCIGMPATTVPLGLNSEGLPIGIQVVANHNNDRLCLAVAEELDKAFGGWIEPRKS